MACTLKEGGPTRRAGYAPAGALHLRRATSPWFRPTLARPLRVGSNARMVATFALLALAATRPYGTPAPITFDTLTLLEAERLDGRRVTVAFVPARPCYTMSAGKELVTVARPADVGGPERTAVLRGNRMRDADKGCHKLTVHGTLRVIRHPASVINGEAFAAFTEIRLEE